MLVLNKYRKPILIGLDSVLILMSVGVSYTFYYWDRSLSMDWVQVMLYAACSVLTGIFMMHRLRLYNRAWRYASIGELISIVKAVTVSCVSSYVLVSLLVEGSVPFSVFVRTFEATLILTGGSRLLWRVYTDNYPRQRNKERKAMIIGAGDCGVLMAREMKFNNKMDLYPACFIDDDPLKHQQQVNECMVVGGRDKILETAAKYQIDDIVIAIPSAPRAEIAKLIEISKNTKAKLHIVPPLDQLIDGKVSLNTIRDVDVEDLLGREPVKLQLAGIADYLQGKTVLVTGAGGSIGSELCRQIAKFHPAKLLLVGHGEYSIYQIQRELAQSFPAVVREAIIADVKDRKRMEQVFANYRPQVVFHAAAHKHVPLMESNPSEAIKNNVFGTKNVAECASKYGTERFVLVSSDKAVNPTSIMGATKRIAEMIIQFENNQSKTIFAAVRFGNVLGSSGSVIPLFKEQIKSGGPVTVTHPDMIRYFMTIQEAAQLVIQAGAYATGGEVFILDMGKPVKIADLARDLIRLSGYEPDVDIEIAYIGIRPGEKLYEELLTAEEGLTSTRHDRIFIGHAVDIDRTEIEFGLKKLERVLTEDHRTIQDVVQHLVPSYEQKQMKKEKATSSVY